MEIKITGMKNTTMIVGAFVLGAGLGAVAGILLAPGAGSETRIKLAGAAQDLANTLKETVMEKLDAFTNPEAREHANQQEEYDRMLGV